MRVLFTTWAWPSHFFPLVPLAWAFRAAGHEVRVASQPALADEIVRSGLPAVKVGRDMGDDIMVRHEHPEITLLDPGTSDPHYAWGEIELAKWQIMRIIFSRMAECMVDDLVEFARTWRPDLIVSDPTTFAGSVAAAALDVPDARLLFGPDITGPRGREIEQATRPPEFTKLFTRFDVEPRYDLARWTIDPTPPTMRTPTLVDLIPIRHVPYSGGYAVADWLLQPPDRPRVCVSWGTFQLQIASEDTIKTPAVLEAAADLDVEVIVVGASRYRHLLQRVPPNAKVFDYLPLDMLLPSCSAIVHQGGPGTALAAAYWGVPQLVLPQVADQGIHSERLSSAGAGIVIAQGNASVERIRAGIGALLGDDCYRQAAASLRKEMLDQPTPAEVVGVLEGLV